MAEGNGEVPEEPMKIEQDVERTEDYQKLIDYGLDEKVAAKLDEIYKTGKLAHVDLDERALDALKEFPVDGALNVLGQFLDSNLEHVSNKSAYLCGVMKTYRQKSRAGSSVAGAAAPAPAPAKGPDEDKIKQILDRTGYTLDVTTGEYYFLENSFTCKNRRLSTVSTFLTYTMNRNLQSVKLRHMK